MAKTFSQIPSVSFDSVARNFRDIGDKSRFGTFTPTLGDFSATAPVGYYQLYGQMCYYHIQMTGTVTIDRDNVNLNCMIGGIPFGPLSTPGTGGPKVGGNTPVAQLAQPLKASDGSFNDEDAGGDRILANVQYAGAINLPTGFVAGDPIINMNVTPGLIWVGQGDGLIVSGWFIRE